MLRDFLITVLFGIVEGVTEWLPVSSTGHLILLEHFVDFGVRDSFFELFEVVIQLGAILAVAVLFWGKLNPFCRGADVKKRREALALWGKVLIAALPSATVGLLLDDWMDAHLYNAVVVAAMLLLYGVAFIVIEKRRSSCALTASTDAIGLRAALGVGVFQVLALIPGTSRSGATILGGVLLGLSRPVAAEFSFFLGIPTMLGAGALKGVKFALSGEVLSGKEWLLLLTASVTAFLTSLAVIRFLMDFVKRHSFAPFGVYRIALGAVVLTVSFL